MEHRALKILLVLLGTFAVFMLYSVVSTKAAETSQTSDPCVLDKKNIYANPDLSVEDKMALYHKTINEKFNEYIEKMISKESAAAKSNKPNRNGLPPKNETECGEGNYSTFCVARDLLTSPKHGYMSYHKALTCSKYNLFETAKEKKAWDKYIAATSLKVQQELAKEVGATSQGARVLMISARLEGIEREIESSKRALDQTLAAYNELRTAWPMHKKYVEIYKNLVTYRDKMAEIRSQAEDFPSKFIDVTTTKCI